MGNFFKGLALGLLGLLVWIVASVLAAFGSLAEDSDDPFAEPVFGALMVVGFLVMVLGPILFWVIVPVFGWWRRRGSK